VRKTGLFEQGLEYAFIAFGLSGSIVAKPKHAKPVFDDLSKEETTCNES
jgi:hypothetical protein